MSVFFSSRVIAADASVKEATGLLLGATVQPFEEVANAARVEVTPTQQPMRCRTCHAYVNPWCKFTCDRARVAKSWTCGVCNAENAELSPRYADVAQETGALVELKAAVTDYVAASPASQQQRAFVFVVDMVGAGDGPYLETVKQCLIAALEGVPKDALVGLVLVGTMTGLFDLGSQAVVCLKQLADPQLRIENVLPLSRFLVSLQDVGSEDAFLLAVEELHRFIEPPTAQRNVEAAVEAIVAYAECYTDLRPLRVGVFLNGRPHDLSSHRIMDIDPETEVYRDLAERSVATSVVWDLFAQPRPDGETLGLASLKFLPMLTGGQLRLSILPQDCFRLYKSVFATQCRLVIRTSPDLAVSTRYFGEREPDDAEQGTRLCCVGDRDAFSFDLEFTTATGIYSEYAAVQVAFSYDHGRVLRIITARVKTTLSWRLLYPAVQPDAHLTLLMHKCIRVCFDSSVEDARLVLKNWLSKLQRVASENGTSLGAFSAVKDVPRFVHALLVSPLLRSVVSGDEWVVVQCMLARLPPHDVQTFLYPQLSSWTTPDKLQTKGIHLNLASASSTNCPWLVLDAYAVIVVKGVGEAPPKDSQLRASIDKVRAQRFFNCDVVYDQTGAVFERYLVDEASTE